MIATLDQARAAIATLPREEIDALVLDILHAVYGECPSTDEDIADYPPAIKAFAADRLGLWDFLNSDVEWTPDNIEMVADRLEHNGLSPNQIALP